MRFCDDYTLFFSPDVVAAKSGGLSFNSYFARRNEVKAEPRSGKKANDYLFQGQERQDEFDLGWWQFKWRNADPAIGRFFNVDPLAMDYVYNTPYAFSENDVISAIELEGLEKYRITNYSKIQSEKLKKNFVAKEPLINRDVYLIDDGLEDDYMQRALKENDIDVPENVKDGKTTLDVTISENEDLIFEFYGVVEDSDGNLGIEKLGEYNKSNDDKDRDADVLITGGIQTIITIIDFFINRKIKDVEILPVSTDPEDLVN